MSKIIIENKNAMTRISSEIEIIATKHQVWGALCDISGIARFHPLVKLSRPITKHTSGLGARRHCKLLPFGTMEECVVEWNDGESFIMQVEGGKMLPPYRHMNGEVKIKETAQGTLVNFTLSYKLKFGLFGRMMDFVLIRHQFRKAPLLYVQGLKTFVEGLR